MSKKALGRSRLEVYKLLISGKPASIISEILDMTESTVSYHVKELLKERYVSVIKGTHSPRLYEKGKNSNSLDGVEVRIEVRNDGGTVNTPAISKPRSRTHINGHIQFPVERVGDRSEIHWKDGDEDKIIKLFGKQPYNRTNGVEFYKTKLPYDGRQVSIELIESTNKVLFKVFPPERKLTPEQLDDAPKIMMADAVDIVNFISKHGGWKFGPGTLVGNVHHGLAESEISSEIPPGMSAFRVGDMWFDRSITGGEPETSDPEKAKVALTWPERTIALEGGQSAILREVMELKLTFQELLEIEKLIVQLEIERKKKVAVQEVERAKASIHPDGAQALQSTIQHEPKDIEVMYR